MKMRAAYLFVATSIVLSAVSPGLHAGTGVFYSTTVKKVLVDAAERATEIDLERARRALERARGRLTREKGAEDVDFVRAETALKRATMRIKVAEKIKKM